MSGRHVPGTAEGWPPGVPDSAWAPLACALLMVVPGLLGLAVGLPWLFPSLGPTAFLHAYQPQTSGARLYNTVVGHLIGIGVGYLAVVVLGAEQTVPIFQAHHLVEARMWASVLAVPLTTFIQIALRANHAPAMATTLLITFGSFRLRWLDALNIIAGVAIVAVIGHLLRKARLGEFTR